MRLVGKVRRARHLLGFRTNDCHPILRLCCRHWLAHIPTQRCCFSVSTMIVLGPSTIYLSCSFLVGCFQFRSQIPDSHLCVGQIIE